MILAEEQPTSETNSMFSTPAENAGPSTTTSTATDVALCRICLDDNQEVSKLICPCNCKGSVARTHSACLEKWVEITHNTNCQICGTDYELESCGWKNVTEWTAPRPLSNEWEDVLDFPDSSYMNATYGAKETNRQITEAIGDGVFAKCWWFAFWMNMIYYGSITVLLTDQWITENRVYRFRDRRPPKKR
ncbi:zinc finger, C3HC4 type [Cooperia oncophora]